MTLFRPKYIGSLVALAVVVVASSCDQPTPAGPEFKLQASTSAYNLVQSTDTSVAENSITIDSAGGTLIVKKHALTVLAGTLQEPVLFTMKTVPGTVQVELHAYSVATGEQITNFRSNVRVLLNYYDTRVKNPAGLKVVYVVDDTIKEFMPSRVDKSNRTVESWVSHFSSYALAID
jgi:hypothetical protein